MTYLKIVLRVVVLAMATLLIIYFTGDKITENEPLEAPVKQGSAIPVEQKEIGTAIPQTSRPLEGVSTFVGQSVKKFTEQYGEPDRIEPSVYGYDWFIYNGAKKVMVGVTEDHIVNQIYTAEESENISPFEIGQPLADMYRFTIIESEVDVQIGENYYTFSLNSEDLQTRLLVLYNELLAQLYVDIETSELIAVRFIEPKTLVLQQPYEMTYMGELLYPRPPSSGLQVEVNRTVERQIFDLTNQFRLKNEVEAVQLDDSLAIFAQQYSKELSLEQILQPEELSAGSLSERLKEAEIEHQKAGENIATNYADSIEAIHGWLNSPKHRAVLLNKDFKTIGIGAYGSYFTQTFVDQEEEDLLDPTKVEPTSE